MRKSTLFTFLTLLTVLCCSQVFAYTEIVNPSELQKRLGDLPAGKNLSDIKIAVLDNGFAGFVPGVGMLPDSAELVEGPLKFPSASAHGLGMAQILWAMSGQEKDGPKIYLVNTNGFTNFKAAVDFVIEKEVDIVLYSQVWLFGSNFDGKGFINEVVNRATNKGIIWINAAGNLGGHVYSNMVHSSKKVFTISNKLDENNFTVTLTWSDFAQSELKCATKDLDLEILDANNKVIQTSSLVQQGQSPDPKDPKDTRSCYARETINLKNLGRGNYKARVIHKSNNFSSSDSFKVIITDDRPGSLEFTDSRVGFEIMPPADNAQVITIGDKSKLSSTGPTEDLRIKPDFLVENSKVNFTNGNETSGSSNAAAMVAGVVAVMKSHKQDLSWQLLLKYSDSLRVQYTTPDTNDVAPEAVPQILQRLIPKGGVIKTHPVTGRAIIFSIEEPLSLPMIKAFNLRLIKNNDLVACLANMSQCGIFPQEQDSSLAAPLVEFRQYSISRTAGSVPPTWINPK